MEQADAPAGVPALLHSLLLQHCLHLPSLVSSPAIHIWHSIFLPLSLSYLFHIAQLVSVGYKTLLSPLLHPFLDTQVPPHSHLHCH